MQQQAMDCLWSWAKSKKVLTDFEFFVFGSLVEDNAEAFYPATSDVDLVLALRKDGLDFEDRVALIAGAKASLSELELQLMQTFQRQRADQPITSTVVITPTERKQAIHKQGDGSLLSAPRFVQISTKKPTIEFVRVSEFDTDSDYDQINRECVGAMREAQDIRNRFLRRAPNTQEFLLSYEGPDPLPKPLMRRAAMVAWSKGDRASHNDRENIRVGLDFMGEELTRRGSGKDVADLRKLLSIRRGGRGATRPIQPLQLLLLWEALFDVAVENLRDSTEVELEKHSRGPGARNKRQ